MHENDTSTGMGESTTINNLFILKPLTIIFSLASSIIGSSEVPLTVGKLKAPEVKVKFLWLPPKIFANCF